MEFTSLLYHENREGPTLNRYPAPIDNACITGRGPTLFHATDSRDVLEVWTATHIRAFAGWRVLGL